MVPAAIEMVLETGAADPSDLPVDDQHLAVVAVAHLVLMPFEAPIVELSVPVERKDVVDDDLDAGRGQFVVDRRGVVEHFSAVAMDARRTSTPAAVRSFRIVTRRSAISPGVIVKTRIWIDDVAAAMSSKIGG